MREKKGRQRGREPDNREKKYVTGIQSALVELVIGIGTVHCSFI